MHTKINTSFLKGRNRFAIILRSLSLGLLLSMVLLPQLSSSVLAQVQAPSNDRIISYQAQVLQNGEPVPDGLYHITASLYTDADARTLLWRSAYAVQVQNGIANLNLGEVRTGGGSLPSTPLPTEGLDGPVYLGIRIGSSKEVLGEEMRPLTRVSSSLNALSVADGSITKEKLATSYVEKIVVGNDTIDAKASTLNLTAGWGVEITKIGESRYLISGDADKIGLKGSGDPWTEDGNSALAGTAFLGTSDASPLPIKVSGSRVMHYSHNATSPIILGGHPSNTTTSVGAVIAGGGTSAKPNDAQGGYGVIGGGLGNITGNNATVVGGEDNDARSNWSFIGGGQNNQTLNDAYTVIAGGFENSITGTGSENSAIGGGNDNEITGSHGVIAGGYDNLISGDYSAIAGGQLLQLGDNSFGFNGYANLVNLQATPSVAYLGDLDVWIKSANTDIAKVPNQLRFYEAPYWGTNYTSFRASTGMSGNVDYVLPGLQGAAGTVLTNDGSGTLSWTSAGGTQWLLAGNTGTTAGAHYIGTNDDEPFEIHVYESGTNTHGKRRVMRYEPTTVSPNLIGGQNANFVLAGKHGATIAGGGENANPNAVMDHYGSIGGGKLNTAYLYASIGGGDNNESIGNYSVIGGGRNNHARAEYSTIGGGDEDTVGIDGAFATVSGGDANAAHDEASTVGGGRSNKAHSFGAVISGGINNETIGRYTTIAGGYSNKIDDHDRTDPTDPQLPKSPRHAAFIGGGEFNVVAADYAIVVGGHEVHAIGVNAFAGGGGTTTESHIDPDYSNRAKGDYSVVVGGSSNEADGAYSFVGGGGFDPDDPVVRQDGNRALTDYSVIVGGKANAVQPEHPVLTPNSGKFGSILGGHNLIAQSHGQTVMGYWNKTQGNQTAATKTSNDRLLIIGNGTGEDQLRSNAFEVSANGHSIVFHEKGATTALTQPIYGATYTDNIIYAWADVPAGTVSGQLFPNAEFGAPVVNFIAPNRYDVTILLEDPYGAPVILNQGSVTANIISANGEDPGCQLLTVSRLSGNSFTVWTSDLNGGDCVKKALPFSFKVTGRP